MSGYLVAVVIVFLFLFEHSLDTGQRIAGFFGIESTIGLEHAFLDFLGKELVDKFTRVRGTTTHDFESAGSKGSEIQKQQEGKGKDKDDKDGHFHGTLGHVVILKLGRRVHGNVIGTEIVVQASAVGCGSESHVIQHDSKLFRLTVLRVVVEVKIAPSQVMGAIFVDLVRVQEIIIIFFFTAAAAACHLT